MLKHGIRVRWHVPLAKNKQAAELAQSHKPWVMSNPGVTLFEEVTGVDPDSYDLKIINTITPAPNGAPATWRYFLIGFMNKHDYNVYMHQGQTLVDERDRLLKALEGLVLSSDHVEFDQALLRSELFEDGTYDIDE